MTKASPAEAIRLLAGVERATARSERLRASARARYLEALDKANEPRRQAVRAAMDADLPRGDIAAAAHVSTARLYQILDGTQTD